MGVSLSPPAPLSLKAVCAVCLPKKDARQHLRSGFAIREPGDSQMNQEGAVVQQALLAGPPPATLCLGVAAFSSLPETKVQSSFEVRYKRS